MEICYLFCVLPKCAEKYCWLWTLLSGNTVKKNRCILCPFRRLIQSFFFFVRKVNLLIQKNLKISKKFGYKLGGIYRLTCLKQKFDFVCHFISEKYGGISLLSQRQFQKNSKLFFYFFGFFPKAFLAKVDFHVQHYSHFKSRHLRTKEQISELEWKWR